MIRVRVKGAEKGDKRDRKLRDEKGGGVCLSLVLRYH